MHKMPEPGDLAVIIAIPAGAVRNLNVVGTPVHCRDFVSVCAYCEGSACREVDYGCMGIDEFGNTVCPRHVLMKISPDSDIKSEEQEKERVMT